MSSSGDNVMEAKAQNQVPINKQDDFDMVKLKKSLKQEQKRSLKQRVAKLTPAEIRSLNHGTAYSESASSSVRNSENRSRHGLASSTPPLTPDTRSHSRNSVYQPQPERRSSSTLPTPPQSPARERRGSNASSRHIVHAPKPMSGTQVAHLTNIGYPSRTPSASSYRGIATYRGPEVTRTGSITMFAHPSPQIVANPLSQFSRPRQSTLTSQAPPRSNSDTLLSNDNASHAHSTERHKSLGDPTTGPSRDHSPVRLSDSPVSMEDGKVSDKPSAGPSLSNGNSAQGQTRSQAPDAVDGHDDSTEPSAKQRLKWRKTINGTNDLEQDLAPLRKEHRRRTFAKQSQCLHAIRYDDTKPGPQPLMRDTLKDELPSVRTSVFKDDAQKQNAQESEYGQHPAVRPFSIDADSNAISTSDSSPSSNKKGKEREVDTDTDSDQYSMTSSVPSYSRCSCCGRVQKAGFESELSPVMENENIRTNFDFEASRTSMDRKHRPSMSNSHKYTPIIPMEVGNEMKQARIEPMPEPPHPVRTDPVPRIMGIVNKPGDVIGPSSTPLAIMPKTRIDPRLSRFGSLHARKEDLQEEEEKQKSESLRNIQATHQLQRFGSLYGIRNEAQSQASPPLPPTPVQTAYQAQQAKHYSMPNVHRPIRSSRLAYQQTAEEVPIDRFADLTPRHAPSVIKGPRSEVDDGPNGSHTEQNSATNDNEDDFAVDLSSFDGSFVHRGISRAATHNVSPPTTSYAQNSFQSPHVQDGHDTDSGIKQSLNERPLQMMQQPVQQPETNIGVALSTPSQSSESLPATRGDWPLPSPDKAFLTNGSTEHVQRHATIVKIVPSAPISSASSQKSANGQLRLGDWILPESPKSASATPTSKGFGSASSVAPGGRPVAAA